MGRFLQVRVSVRTVDEEPVAAAWPRLIRLAWAGGLPPEGRRGVLELIAALFDRLTLGMLPPDAAEALDTSIRKAEAGRLALEEALAARQPAAADKRTYDIEDALDEAEERAGKL
jgi:hypothetical protein